MAFSDDDGAVNLYDADTGTDLLNQGLFCDSVVGSLAFSVDGSHLAIGKLQGILYLVNMKVLTLDFTSNDPQTWGGMKMQKCLLRGGDIGLVTTLSFSPNGERLATAVGSMITILYTETAATLLTVELRHQSVLSIDYKFCLPGSHAFSRQEGPRADLEDDEENSACVMQDVDHPMADFAEEILPLEAAQLQDELWASAVERRIADAKISQNIVLLTFARQTQLLEQTIFASPLVRNATWCVQPDWAKGAKILVNLEPHVLQAMLPRGQGLKPWHVVIWENAEEAFNAAIAFLPEDVRRLKCVTGRHIMYCGDVDSMQANVEPEHMVAEVDVKHTFVHFSYSHDDRSVRTV